MPLPHGSLPGAAGHLGSTPVAHAFGARYDLPVPLWLFVLGGALVVFASFLFVLPRTVAEGPGADAGGAARRPGPRRAVALPQGLGMVLLAALVAAGIAGTDSVAENIVPTAIWIVAWIAVPISCGVVGDWTRPLNPFATIARLVDHDGLRRTLIAGPALRWPRWLGWWPATALFFAVACGELIFNATATLPQATGWGLLVYALLTALGSLLFGAETWLERAELWSVLYSTWGRLGWFRFGRPGRSGLAGGLDQPFERSVSRLTFVLLLLVSVSFDGMLATPAWRSWRFSLPSLIQVGSTGYLLFTTAIFVLLVLAAWALFGLFSLAVRAAGHLDGGPLEVVAWLVPSLLPIAFGYLVAHNAYYLLVNGQLLIPLLGDPAGRGWHLLPAPFNDTYEINRNIVPTSVVWYFQVALIISVHIAAVVIAHNHLGRMARTVRHARRSEWPWIVAMVGYTMTSLWLLAQPIVEEGRSSSSATTVTERSPAVGLRATVLQPDP